MPGLCCDLCRISASDTADGALQDRLFASWLLPDPHPGVLWVCLVRAPEELLILEDYPVHVQWLQATLLLELAVPLPLRQSNTDQGLLAESHPRSLLLIRQALNVPGLVGHMSILHDPPCGFP